MSPQPKVDIPILNETCINVGDWFSKYELACELCGWEKSEKSDTRAKFLPMYLGGLVATSYSQFSDVLKTDYDQIKLAIQKRYGLKPNDAYRRFVSGRYTPGVALDGYIDELRRLIDCVASIPSDSKDVLVLNQFLISIPDEAFEKLTMACDEDGKMNFDRLIEKARGMIMFRPTGSSSMMSFQSPISAALQHTNQGVRGPSTPHTAKRSVRCYNCNEIGHISSECTKPQKKKTK